MRKKIIITLLLLTFTLIFTGCKKDSNDKEINNVIRWGVPDIYRISDEALSEFNKRLIDLGYDFSLEIVQLDFLDCQSAFSVLKEYENEEDPLDIAFIGLPSREGKGKELELIKSGYYAPLDEFLNTSEAEKLLELYDEKLWESVKVDGNIFLIPSGAGQERGITFAFNKKHVNEEDIKDFTGDLFQLEEYMEKVPFDKEFSHIIYELEGLDLFEVINSDYRYGLMLPWDKSGASNPYENQEFQSNLKIFKDYYNSQYINYDFSLIDIYGEFKDDTEELEDDAEELPDATELLKTGNFFVYISKNIDLLETNTDVIVYENPAYIQSRLIGTGITADSANKEDAFQLLVLAYTDEELANLLIHGVEGVDYILEGGKAYDIDGSFHDFLLPKISLGIYEMTYPNGEEDFEISKLADKKKYYQEKVVASPYLGFNFYNEEQNPIIKKIEETVTNNLDIWKREDIDKEFDRVNEELKEQGIDELVTLVNEALDEFYE